VAPIPRGRRLGNPRSLSRGNPSWPREYAAGVSPALVASERWRVGGFLKFLEDSHVAAEAYCVKCKTKREISDAVQITMKNGRPATEGKCPVCGTKMFKIGAAK